MLRQYVPQPDGGSHFAQQNKTEENKVVGRCVLRVVCRSRPSAFNSKIVLEESGIMMEKFSSRQLKQSMIDKSRAVICMTEMQKQIIEGCGNVYCIKDFCGTDVPDPFGCELPAYRAARDLLMLACDNIINKIILSDQR